MDRQEPRTWRRRRLRLVSSAGNTYNRDYLYAPTDPGQGPRHVSTLEPLWNLFDFTREGRPTDWDEQLSYS